MRHMNTLKKIWLQKKPKGLAKLKNISKDHISALSTHLIGVLSK